jgi:hypothetical protein
MHEGKISMVAVCFRLVANFPMASCSQKPRLLQVWTWHRFYHIQTWSCINIKPRGQWRGSKKVVWETLKQICIEEEQEMNDFEKEIFFTPPKSPEKEPEIELLMDIN